MIIKLFKSMIKKNMIKYHSRHFLSYGDNVSIKFGKIEISNPENISIGNNVSINYGTWIAARPFPNCKSLLEIGNNTIIGRYNHIYASTSIKIGNGVLFADKVYVSDNLHEYEDVTKPILEQPIKQLKLVNIGDESWIGENVSIIGASIGRHCVIGANSVVTHDIPDYSVAVGVPAKVIKKYNHISKKWEKQI